MKNPVLWKANFYAWATGLILAFIGYAQFQYWQIVYGADSHSSVKVTIFMSLALLPAYCYGFYEGFRTNLIGQSSVGTRWTIVLKQGWRVGLLTVLFPIPAYFVFATYWSLAVQHRPLQGSILLVVGLIFVFAWLWVAKKVWNVIMDDNPRGPADLRDRNVRIFNNAMVSLFVSIAAALCLVAGYVMINGQQTLFGIISFLASAGLWVVLYLETERALRRLNAS